MLSHDGNPPSAEAAHPGLKDDFVAKATSRVTDAFVVFMFGVFPLLLGANKYYTFTQTRLIAFYVATVALAAIVLVLSIVRIATSKVKFSPSIIKKITITDFALLAYVVIAALSAHASFFPQYAYGGIPTREDGLYVQVCYALIYFIVSRTYRYHPAHIVAMALSSLVVCGYGVLQFYGFDLLQLDESGMTYLFRMFYSTFGNLDVMSTYTTAVIAIFGSLFILGKRKTYRLCLLPALLAFYMQIILNTMAGWVALTICVLLMIPRYTKDFNSTRRLLTLLAMLSAIYQLFQSTYYVFVREAMPLAESLHSPVGYAVVFLMAVALLYGALGRHASDMGMKAQHIISCVLCFLGAALVILYGFYIYSGQEENLFYEMRGVMTGYLNDEWGSGRGYVWRYGLQLFRFHPWIGSGPDTFGSSFVDMYGAQTTTLLRVVVDKAHNDYLQILICCGSLGLAAFLTFLLSTVFRAYRRSGSAFAYSTRAAVLVYAVQAAVTFAVPLVNPIIWTIWGICGAMFARKQNASRDRKEP